MSEPLSRWLALREPADVAARSEALTRRMADIVTAADGVSILDLAAGTGSNLRFLADRLPGRQAWLLADRDPLLLSEAAGRTAAWAAERGYECRREAGGSFVIRGARLECRVETRQIDLGTLGAELFAGRHLVTASALLDLVSEEWLRALSTHCRAAAAAALFTITYNGRSSCTPADPDDEMVRALMNQHQKSDKGLGGAAAGPDAADAAERCFRDAGYVVEREPTDWVLDPDAPPIGLPRHPHSTDANARLQRDDRDSTGRLTSAPLSEARVWQPDLQAFQRLLIEGWAEAATETAPHRARPIARWKERRLEHVAAGRSRIVVGHDDLAAWLPQR
jgi:hypothetical protein